MPTRPEYSSPALQVASDATFAVIGDAYDTTNTKTTPSLGEIKQGLARPKQQSVARWRNWLDNAFASVLVALADHVTTVQDVDLPAEVSARSTADAAILATIRTIPCLNWTKVGAVGAFQAMSYGGDESAAMANKHGVWVGVGTNLMNYSFDYGRTWTSITPPTAALQTVDVAMQDGNGFAGIAVNDGAAPGSATFFYNTGTTISSGWTNGTLPAAVTVPNVKWEPTAGLFCIAGTSSAGVPVVYTTPTGAAVTTRAAPAGFPGTASYSALGRYKAGARLYWAVQSGSTVYVATSTDGGASWTLQSTIAVFSNSKLSGISVDASTGRVFVAQRGDSTSFQADQIFYSDDSGASWTTRTLNGSGGTLTRIASFNGVCVAGKQSGTVIYSPDDGATWYPAVNFNQVASASGPIIAVGGGGFMAVCNTTIFASDRYAQPGAAVST